MGFVVFIVGAVADGRKLPVNDVTVRPPTDFRPEIVTVYVLPAVNQYGGDTSVAVTTLPETA